MSIQEKLDSFLERHSTHPDDRRALIAFLDADPRRASATSYFEQIEERLELARQLKELIEVRSKSIGVKKPPSTTAAFWSTMMVVDLPVLRATIQRLAASPEPLELIVLSSAKLPLLFKLFLTKQHSNDDICPYEHWMVVDEQEETEKKEDEEENEGNGKETTTKKKKKRDDAGRVGRIKPNHRESSKCRHRDGDVCIITGASNPEVCHIFPFASLNNTYTPYVLNVMSVIYRDEVVKRYRELLTSHGNIVDAPQNMLCMNGTLQKWWRMGRFALKPVTKLKNGIRLEFHWLQTAGKMIRDTVPIDTDPRPLLKDFSDVSGCTSISNSRTCRPILTGEIFDIVSDDESLLPSYDILQLQWDLLRMVSLNGASEEPDDEGEDGDDDEEEVGSVAEENEEEYEEIYEAWYRIEKEEEEETSDQEGIWETPTSSRGRASITAAVVEPPPAARPSVPEPLALRPKPPTPAKSTSSSLDRYTQSPSATSPPGKKENNSTP
ncbi:hypothetical protein GGR54DRAFT_647936 [Hypoxylon sp. NC1633]|nr:hypothetical protein GGR54DRAFT_647936 [Hypoxylon sp. NC1633]